MRFFQDNRMVFYDLTYKKQFFQNSEHMFGSEDIKLIRNLFIVEIDKRNQRILIDEYFILNILSYYILY